MPLPFELPGFHWGDDIVFEDAAESLDADPGFSRSTKILVRDVIFPVLIDKLGYRAREIMIFGFAQGATVALSAALEVARVARERGDEKDKELGGVVAVGGVLPVSAIKEDGRREKASTPVLITGGQGKGSAVTEAGVRRTKDAFQYVDVVKWTRRGDAMPGNREEMLPIMHFFARRLRSRSGVPEGSVELS